MKIPTSALIEKACYGDASRPVLNAVYLKTASAPHPAYLLATNGRIAAYLPVVTDEADKAGYVTAEALKAARKGAKGAETASFSANGVCKMADGQEFARPDLGNYPNMESIKPKDEVRFTVSLDPELLLQLAEAIGAARGVILEVRGENSAIVVRPCVNPRAENAKGRKVGYVPAELAASGLIMPVVK